MKVMVLGVGNLLLSDEGVGVRVIEELSKRYRFPENVVLIDGGTIGVNLLYFLEGVEKLLIVDAVLGGMPPGSIYKFKDEEVLTYFRTKKLSAHDIGIQEVLSLAKLTEKLPKEMVVLGIEPESLDVSLELSSSVKEALERLLDEVIKQLKEWNIKVGDETDKLQRT
ncbi:MAG: HyaD/HybD family hydrogenase maturation endopeptidase [Aquificaceae bacterium]